MKRTSGCVIGAPRANRGIGSIYLCTEDAVPWRNYLCAHHLASQIIGAGLVFLNAIEPNRAQLIVAGVRPPLANQCTPLPVALRPRIHWC